MNPQEIQQYRESIFNPPMSAGLLTRAVLHGYLRLLSSFLTGDDLVILMRSVMMLGGGLVLAAILICATPADLLMVFGDSGYLQPSEIYGVDSEGKTVKIAEFYQSSRRVIELDGKTDHGTNSKAARAFIATEDTNFFYHPGIDVFGILRAVFVNLRSGSIKEGASTITQQVSRLRFLSSERSFARKAREAFLALLIEMRFSKRRILELYFNEVPLGHNTYGVEAASRFYFNKGVFDLSWGEAAVLASLTTRPRDFSPLVNINESRRKVRVVFYKLIENGDMDIDTAQKEYRALEENFYANLFERSPNENAFSNRLNLHPYVSEFIKYSLPARFSGRKLLTGGYRIYTTINVDHQKAAEETFQPWLVKLTEQRRRPPFRNYFEFDREFGQFFPLIKKLFDLPEFASRITREERDFQREYSDELESEMTLLNYLTGGDLAGAAFEQHFLRKDFILDDQLPVEGSLVSIRPETGEITAVVGGSGFASRNQNLRFIQSRRQPGSAFKPILYASGIESSAGIRDPKKSLTAATVLDDSPVQFVSEDLSEYSPENFGSSYEGPIRLRKALTYSKNAVAVRVYERMGSRALNATAEKLLQLDEMNPQRHLPREASVALGSYEVSPLEMARAFAVFASNGREVHPFVISYITDPDGEIVLDNRPKQAALERRQVISPGTAEIITSMLRDVVRMGTGVGAALSGWDAVGKTGTTNRGTDAWFVGYTPVLVTAVHIGYDKARSLGPSGTGGSIAAPVWGRYMNLALRNERVRNFSFPGSNVQRAEICALSGKLPGEKCHETVVEMFLPGTVPTEICDEHDGGRSERKVEHRQEDIFRDEDFQH